MFKNDRFAKILELLGKKKVMRTRDLQQALFVSGSTLRRDLLELEKMGKITRQFGHVRLVKPDNVELSYLFREQEHEAGKRYIADLASNFLGDNQSCFIDSSSTASFLAPYCSRCHNFIVITNGLRLAVELDDSETVTTFVSGGRLRNEAGSLVGTDTLAFLDNFRADLAFLSCAGITPDGVFMSSLEQASVKRKMMARADRTILLCDQSKFGVKSYYQLCSIDQIATIITDAQPAASFTGPWQAADVDLMY